MVDHLVRTMVVKKDEEWANEMEPRKECPAVFPRERQWETEKVRSEVLGKEAKWD
jgi:hypothetical protein